jgi:hypothetical protein
LAELAQYARTLEKKIKALEEGIPLNIAVQSTIPIIAQRIFESGQDVNNTSIGQYSKKPIYIDPAQAPKAVNRTGKRGKAIKSGYYKGGYYEFRGQQGRENSFVNLRLNNELQSDFLNASVSRTSNSVPQIKSAEPFKVNANLYQITLKKPINQEKKKGLESKYGTKIFAVSSQEKEAFFKVLSFENNRVLQ